MIPCIVSQINNNNNKLKNHKALLHLTILTIQALIVDMLVQLNTFGKILVYACSNLTFHIGIYDLLIISQSKYYHHYITT